VCSKNLKICLILKKSIRSFQKVPQLVEIMFHKVEVIRLNSPFPLLCGHKKKKKKKKGLLKEKIIVWEKKNIER
jgi:hypothetical protein